MRLSRPRLVFSNLLLTKVRTKETEPRRHRHDEGCRGQYPGGIAGADLVHVLILGGLRTLAIGDLTNVLVIVLYNPSDVRSMSMNVARHSEPPHRRITRQMANAARGSFASKRALTLRDLVHVLGGDPAVAAFARPVRHSDPDRVARIARLRPHDAGITLDDHRPRTGLGEERVDDDLVAVSPVAAGVVDNALLRVPHEHVGVQLARLQI